MKKRFLSVVILLVLLSTMLAAPAYAKNIIPDTPTTEGSVLTYKIIKNSPPAWLIGRLRGDDYAYEGDVLTFRFTIKNESEMTFSNVVFGVTQGVGDGIDFVKESFKFTKGDFTSDFVNDETWGGGYIKSTGFDLAPGEFATLTFSAKIKGVEWSGGGKRVHLWVNVFNYPADNPKFDNLEIISLYVLQGNKTLMTLLMAGMVISGTGLVFEICALVRLKRKIREEEKMDNEKPSV